MRRASLECYAKAWDETRTDTFTFQSEPVGAGFVPGGFSNATGLNSFLGYMGMRLEDGDKIRLTIEVVEEPA